MVRGNLTAITPEFPVLDFTLKSTAQAGENEKIRGKIKFATKID